MGSARKGAFFLKTPTLKPYMKPLEMISVVSTVFPRLSGLMKCSDTSTDEAGCAGDA